MEVQDSEEMDQLIPGQQPHQASDVSAADSGNADEDFLCGIALSVYQNSGSGGHDTNWGAWENRRIMFQPTIAHGDKCGTSNDFWNLFEADIQRSAQLNVKLFRLSIEWSRIQPRPGEVDLAAVQRYHQMFDVMDRLGMQSTVTLMHFVHPLWFDKLGHWEKAENIQYFVDFVKIAFKHFGRRTQLWATFNEVNVQVFCGYVYGSFPPGRRFGFGTAGKSYLHMYQAHIAAYDAIKASDGGDQVQVGIVHNHMEYEPKHPLAFSAAWVTPIVRVINQAWGNDMTVEFFKTGLFAWPKFFTEGFTWQYPAGRPPCDFIGLNYYGRALIDWTLQPTHRTGDMTTDMPFPAYAPGLYTAIAAMADIGLPIYITETGICDHTTLKRPAFFRAYFEQIVKAVEDGHDVRGITVWTLVDNFEWAYGWGKKFGLYGWQHGDPDNTRVLHDTSKVVGDMYLELPDKIRNARKTWSARRRQGDTLPRHVPALEERATEHLKHFKVKSALKTHQVGVL
jgi:beta-glucosidase/6-phospho-beta-glucosidase/beta-galactosidase